MLMALIHVAHVIHFSCAMHTHNLEKNAIACMKQIERKLLRKKKNEQKNIFKESKNARENGYLYAQTNVEKKTERIQ